MSDSECHKHYSQDNYEKFKSCRLSIIHAISILLIIQFFIGCTTSVKLNNFRPTPTTNLDIYRGKRIYLMNFDNQANDTSIWYYYSANGNFRYSYDDDVIHNYFWYSMEDYLSNIGTLVSNAYNPDSLAPALSMTLLSITDLQFRTKITIQKRGITTLQKIFTVSESPMLKKDRNIQAAEQRSYRMANRLFENILLDGEVQWELAY